MSLPGTMHRPTQVFHVNICEQENTWLHFCLVFLWRFLWHLFGYKNIGHEEGVCGTVADSHRRQTPQSVGCPGEASLGPLGRRDDRVRLCLRQPGRALRVRVHIWHECWILYASFSEKCRKQMLVIDFEPYRMNFYRYIQSICSPLTVCVFNVKCLFVALVSLLAAMSTKNTKYT